MSVLNSKAAAYAAVAAVGIAAVYFIGRKTLKGVGEAVNPLSDQNIFYRGTNAVGSAISGNDDWSLGSWIYDVLHPNEGKKITGPTDPDEVSWWESLREKIL